MFEYVFFSVGVSCLVFFFFGFLEFFMIYDSIFDIIGGMFIVKLYCFVLKGVDIYVKVEVFNFGGLVKDCLVLVIILDVEKCGVFKLG